MSAPGTPKASQAAITAVQEALGCKPGKHWHVVQWVTYGGNAESVKVTWTERGCPVAVAAADASAPHIAAQALREAEMALRGAFPKMKSLPLWLRDRADRIEDEL